MSEHPAFVGTVEAGEATGEGWRLSDETAASKLLVYESFGTGDAVTARFGARFGSSAAAAGGGLTCGVRPGEWLLLGGDSTTTSPIDETVAVDLTHGLAMFRLTGPAATEVLAAVCSIDTSEEMMPDGAVCGASVARVACTLVRNDTAGERSYLILAERSYGRYLFDALRDAGVR